METKFNCMSFLCKHCGYTVTTKKFEDKTAVACEACGIIWEVKPDGSIELELLQLVGGVFGEEGYIDKNPRQSVFPEILKTNVEALSAWNTPARCGCED